MPGSPDGDATFGSWDVGHAPEAARPSELQRRHGTLARDDANETAFAFHAARSNVLASPHVRADTPHEDFAGWQIGNGALRTRLTRSSEPPPPLGDIRWTLNTCPETRLREPATVLARRGRGTTFQGGEALSIESLRESVRRSPVPAIACHPDARSWRTKFRTVVSDLLPWHDRSCRSEFV